MRSATAMLLLAGWVSSTSLAAAGEERTVDLGDAASAAAAVTSPRGASPAGDQPPYRISPDSQYVVQRVASGLFSRRLPDGPWTHLAPPSSCWDDSDRWLITDDSLTVLFTCPGPTGPPKDLWAVPIGGPAAAAVLLSTAPEEPSGVVDFFSATSASRVFYTMNRLAPDRIDLYSVPVAGPASEGVVINGALGEFESASGPFPLQALSRVVYRRSRLAPQGDEIWLTDLAAANAIAIGVPPPSHPSCCAFQVSPDEQSVVWSAGGANVPPRIYSSPISDPPGAAIQLNPDLPASAYVSLQAISPDSTRVALRANPEDPARYDLFSVPIGGPSSSAVNLSASVQTWDPLVLLPRFSPDGAWLLYLASREVQSRRDLYRVPAGGPASANLRINPVETASSAVRSLELVPGTADVVFPLVGPGPDETLRCYRGSWLGALGNATPLWTESLRFWGIGLDCHWLAESRGVLTIAIDPSLPLLSLALWLAHGDGPPDQRPKKLLDSAQFEPGGHPFGDPFLAATPDGKYVVYVATPIGGEEELWVLPLPYFWDGFESGGLGQWSSVQP